MAQQKYIQASTITPHDVNTVSDCQAIYIGVTGDVKVKLTEDSNFVTFKNMQQGTLYPLECKVVHTGTTATDLVALDSNRTW